MSEMEQAHHELDRIQGIIGRHEGHMFSLRGWLFAALAGVVAAQYSIGRPLSLGSFSFVVLALVLAFVYAELRHVILVDAAVARTGAIEGLIAEGRRKGPDAGGWYDGPRINEVCREAARRILPRLQMTLALNFFFYLALGAAVFVLVWLLPVPA